MRGLCLYKRAAHFYIKHMTQRILIGKIASSHGVKGLVKVDFYAEDTSLLDQAVYTSEKDNKTLKIKLKSKSKNQYLAEIEGITDKNSSDTLKGTQLYIERDMMPELDEDEFYLIDLIGLPCFDEQGQEVGTVTAVQNFGASDLLEIKPKGKESFYLPYSDICVKDIKEDRLIVDLPEYL
ncbi:MAG: 16S rRNA processing protein RimM [Micavibrio sp.]|nr:16S rRNA processing protein RimM [Micavibrio sp.]|tara:strand:+ start:136 stop:675 length:540 start_codon:yes stop_codon:yes gene_type:complete